MKNVLLLIGIITAVGLLHWGFYELLPVLFNHGSSSAFEMGVALIFFDLLFWAAVVYFGALAYKDWKRKHDS